jgi:hypothetical protein
MKTKNKLTITALDGMDAVVSNNNEVFAKQKLQLKILTRKSIFLASLALLMLMVIVLPFVSCGGDEEEQPEPVGYATFGEKQIPIYAGEGVTQAEANAKKGEIDAAFKSIGSAENTRLKSVTQKIVIVNGSAYSATKATGTIELGKNLSQDDVFNVFIAIVFPAFAKVIDNSRNTVRMAKAFVIGNAKSI